MIIKRWRLFLGFMMIGAVAMPMLVLLLARLSPAYYQAVMVIGPVARHGAATMGAVAGLQMPLEAAADRPMAEWRDDEIVSDYTRFLQVMIGPVVARELLKQQPDLAAMVMKLHWDDRTKQWQPPSGFSAWLARQLRIIAGRPGWLAPGPLELSQRLADVVEIRPVAETALHRLIVRDPDPYQATLLLNHLYHLTEETLRHEARRRLQVQIDYTTRQLATVTQASQREAMGQLLGRFSQAQMMLAVDLPFAADLVTPPIASNDGDQPPLMLILAMSIVLGAMGGGLLGLAIMKRTDE